MGRSTQEALAARVAHWKSSGLTAAEFASEGGVSPRSPSWWKWQVGSTTRSASPKRARARRQTECIRPVYRPLPGGVDVRQDRAREWYALSPSRQQSAERRGPWLASSSFWD